jgi:hypothetical protein
MFFDRLLSITDGTLKGMRILDLGCNAGFWSLLAIEAGADFVLGIDGRQMHVDQADLIFEARAVDRSRYRFEVGNFLHYPLGSFDIALCLGVLYHVSSPVELFNLMAATGAELLVIDTEVSQLSGNLFVLYTESLETHANALEDETVAHPTRGAINLYACRQTQISDRCSRHWLHHRQGRNEALSQWWPCLLHLFKGTIARPTSEGGVPVSM